VVVDLSGRSYAVFEGEFTSPAIGALPTSLVGHFFESLAQRGKLNLHAQVLYGRDDHHKAEALFKALGRALAVAAARDERRAETSTKGTLKG
jgi:imidazoleglycerol-phosphate dehydratase